jgi:hypothetical protein
MTAGAEEPDEANAQHIAVRVRQPALVVRPQIAGCVQPDGLHPD